MSHSLVITAIPYIPRARVDIQGKGVSVVTLQVSRESCDGSRGHVKRFIYVIN
jgi:hypothetical protein